MPQLHEVWGELARQRPGHLHQKARHDQPLRVITATPTQYLFRGGKLMRGVPGAGEQVGMREDGLVKPRRALEVVLPAFARHYGYPAGSREIEFFTEHAEADIEHSQRQAALCAKYLDTEAVKVRAREVAETACMLRWASITDLYRRDYLGEKEILPGGLN